MVASSREREGKDENTVWKVVEDEGGETEMKRQIGGTHSLISYSRRRKEMSIWRGRVKER